MPKIQSQRTKISLFVAGLILGPLVTGCSSVPDHRIDMNYDDVVDQQKELKSMNQTIETSHPDEPEFVTALLDTWDCGTEFCAVGRAEIEADGASPFSCLEISKINARANLLSTVKMDLSKRVMTSLRGTALNKQKLQALTTSGFTIEGVSNLKISKNYYRKNLKDISGTPVAVYQCFTVASLNKRHLKDLIETKAEQTLTRQENSTFKKRVDEIWDSLFKLDTPVSSRMETSDIEARASIRGQSLGSVDEVQETVVRVSKAFLELPYQLGGDLKDGSLDCSNYIRLVYRSVGFQLPRISPQQYRDPRGLSVSGDLEKGDLLFFSGSLRPSNQVSHVAMYIGNGQMIHASGDQKKVLIDAYASTKWEKKLIGAKRFIRQENFPNQHRLQLSRAF